MDTIYQNAIISVTDGSKFNINFCTRSLKIDGKYIIKDGQYEGCLGVELCSEADCLKNIESLYLRYKNSVPSERSESKSRKYFFALPEREVSDEDMMFGERRDKAQLELELYVLCQILNGFQWNQETMGKWFWQSKTDKDLVILRKWTEP